LDVIDWISRSDLIECHVLLNVLLIDWMSCPASLIGCNICTEVF